MRKIYLPVLLLIALLLTCSLAFSQGVEYIIQYDDGSSFYYSGRPDPNDTCGVWFEPPTESQIISGLFQFNSGMGGLADVYLWGLTSSFDPEDYWDTDEVSGVPGPSPLDTIIAGPIEYPFDNSGVWQEIIFEDWGVPPGDLDVGTSNFFLGYVLHGGGFNPSINGDIGDDRPYHSLCYLTTPGGVHPTEPGWWAYGIDWMLRCKVNMYGDPPPFVEGLTDPPDTYANGPYTIAATIYDYDESGLPGSGQVTEARLIYAINGGDPDTTLMTNTSGDEYVGDIPNLSPGSSVNFRVEADDNANHTSISPSLAGYNFARQMWSGAKILLVNDAGTEEEAAIYRSSLENNGFSYDYWFIAPGNSEDMGYPGHDVISHNYYNTVLWFNGTANSGSLPDNDVDLWDDPVADFMELGGNFFLSSSDYIGGAFNPDVWTEFTAVSGSFMYEYLMVNNGWSDAHMDSIGGEYVSRDTVYYGLGGDPVSGNFVTPFENHPSPNYNDFVYARSGAVDCFFTEIDAEPAGIRYDGNFKMVFLPWVLEASDPAIAEGILLDVLAYFGDGAGPEVTVLRGSRYGIYGDDPDPVWVEVNDPDGIEMVYLKLKWDDGNWVTYTMIDQGSNIWRRPFYAPVGWSSVQWRVLAKDNLGNVTVDPTIYDCWYTGLTYNPGDNFLYCSDQPYAFVYGNFDTTITDKLVGMGVNFGVWDAGSYGTPDYWTVLIHYNQCFWVGYADYNVTMPYASADNPFSLFLGMGRSLLFSSDEQMGVWTGWANTDFVPGDFAYDWLKLESTINDPNYEQVVTFADSMTLQMDATVALNDLGNGYWADYLVPQAANTFTFMDGWVSASDQDVGAVRDNSAQNNIVTLGFCLYTMETANREQFIENVITYWDTHQGFSVGVEPSEPTPVIPKEYSLEQNYPNPFNPFTQIRFDLPENARVELTIYNTMGQEVARLLDRNLNAGSHVAVWDASQISSGVYFYKLTTQNFVQTRKMILVK